MVHMQVLVVFTFCAVIASVKTADVVYRTRSQDGTYSEVHQSHSASPVGQTKVVTTFSSRVLGSTDPISAASGPTNRLLKPPALGSILSPGAMPPMPLQPFGLLGQPSPGGSLVNGIFDSVGGSLSRLGSPGGISNPSLLAGGAGGSPADSNFAEQFG